MKKKSVIFIVILILIQAGFLVFFGMQKKGMHFDEFFSYFNTNNSVGRQVYDRTYLEREDIAKDFYVKEGEGFNYSYVIKLQGYDVHPPVYYLLLHTVCSFTPLIFSYWQGLFVNILFLSIAIIFIYLSVYELTSKEIIAFIISAFVAINPGTLSNGMFIRMYALLTMWICISIYLHIKMEKDMQLERLSWKYILLNGALAYVGFLTHYFYLAFLFFIEASFWIPRLFQIKKYYKVFFKYTLTTLLFGILGVVSFPQCLGHVNSGYRGVEVKSNMFNFSDIGNRFSFFGGLINKFVFGGCLVAYVFLIVVIIVNLLFLRKKTEKKSPIDYSLIRCIIIPVFGYFVISAKGSLIGEEAMMRYQLPIYGLCIVVFALIIYMGIDSIIADKKAKKVLFFIMTLSFLCITVLSLSRGNVYYLYPEQDMMKAVAKNNSDKECVYIYNNDDNKYFLWNDVEQLLQYDRVYFVNSENTEALQEESICQSNDLIVYVSTLNRCEDFGLYENLIFDSNSNVHEYNKLYEGTYADCYEFK